MPELLELMARARASQPATFAPAFEPEPIVGPCDAKRYARRRLLVELMRDLETARAQRAEWYVWIAECYAKR